MSASSLIALCHMSAQGDSFANKLRTIRIIHMTDDQLCRWQPDREYQLLSKHIANVIIEGTCTWAGSAKHNYGHMLDIPLPEGYHQVQALTNQCEHIRPIKVRFRIPLRLASWLRRAESLPIQELTAALALPDEDLLAQFPRITGSEDVPATEREAKTQLLSKFNIRLGTSKSYPLVEVEEWLTDIAGQLLRAMPLKEMLVMLHAFIPQISYGNVTRHFLQAMRSGVPLKHGITLRPAAKGQHGLHEFHIRNHAPSWPVGAWIPLRSDDSRLQTYAQWLAFDDRRVNLGIDWGDVLLFVFIAPLEQFPSLQRVSRSEPGVASLNASSAASPIEGIQPQFAVVGIVTDIERYGNATDKMRRAKFKKAIFTHIPGTKDLVNSSGLRDCLADVYLGLPEELNSLHSSYTLTMVNAFRLGATVSGSQLLKVTRLAPEHKPLVLGVSTPLSISPFVVHAHADLVTSLRLLLNFLVTGIVPEQLVPQAPFCHQLRQEALRDSGHFILLAVGVLVSLLTGRASLAAERIFGAGKTTSIVMLLAWLVVSTPEHVKFAITSRENPAGQAVTAQVMRLKLTEDMQMLFVRACSFKEMDDLGDSRTPLDVLTRNSGPRIAKARVLIATTGAIHDAMDSIPIEFGAPLNNASIFVHEEAQQAIEYKSAVAIATPDVPCLNVLVGDGNQAPGGVDSKNKAAQALRRELMTLPIGLKAPKRGFTPATYGLAVCALIDNIDNLDRAELLSHLQLASHRSVFSPWTASPAHMVIDTEATEWIRDKLDPNANLDLSSPVGNLLAVGVILARSDSLVTLHSTGRSCYPRPAECQLQCMRA